MASPFMTGPFVPVAMLNLIRGVLGIHHHRFNLSVKRSSCDVNNISRHAALLGLIPRQVFAALPIPSHQAFRSARIRTWFVHVNFGSLAATDRPYTPHI